MRLRQLALVAGLASASAPAALNAAASIPAAADNTLYQDSTGGLSNGAGEYMFCGLAAGLRRAVVQFDVAGSIPANATINSAVLSLYMSRTNPSMSTVAISLHRLLAPWGEGSADAGDPGGAGTAASGGDATWIHTFSPGIFWTMPGGDFVTTPSATTMVTGLGTYSWSGAQLDADVQDMLDNPSTNYGWILIGEEAGPLVNAKRFNTREHVETSLRPNLEVDYSDPPVGVEASQWSAVKALFR
jgi:hypothetical protein